jgi:hypothetical protein
MFNPAAGLLGEGVASGGLYARRPDRRDKPGGSPGKVWLGQRIPQEGA